jgi:hypothetical protein
MQTFTNTLLFERLLDPCPNPNLDGHPLVASTRSYIRSYPSYLEAVSFIRNPRTRHGVVTRDPVNTDTFTYLFTAYLMTLSVTEKNTVLKK